jgi:hypothetical protein
MLCSRLHKRNNVVKLFLFVATSHNYRMWLCRQVSQNHRATLFLNSNADICPGWPDECVKKSPNMLYNPFLGENWANFVIFPKLPKANNHPIGENSPNLITQRAILNFTPDPQG